MTQATLTSKEYLTFITKQCGSDTEKLRWVNDQVVELTGGEYTNIIDMHNRAAEEIRLEVYKNIIRGLKTQGTVMQPQPHQQAERTPVASEGEEPEQPPVAPRVTVPEKEPPPSPIKRNGDPLSKLREVIESLGVNMPAQVDETTIVAKVKEAVDPLVKRIEELEARKPSVTRIEVVTPERTVQIEGRVHRQFPQVLTWLSAKVPVWLWGASASGKTHMSLPLAKALGLESYVVPIDELITISRLMGYNNAGNGTFVPGMFYRPYTQGGLLTIDEIDLAQPAIAACNSMISQQTYIFPSGDRAEKHKDLYILACANTKGTGPTAGYTARFKLDAATLDRFAIIKAEYDEDMEGEIFAGMPASNKEPWKPRQPASDELCRQWFQWVVKVRKECPTVLISPRCTQYGVPALKAGVPPMEVADALVFKLMQDMDKERVLRSCGNPPEE